MSGRLETMADESQQIKVLEEANKILARGINEMDALNKRLEQKLKMAEDKNTELKSQISKMENK